MRKRIDNTSASDLTGVTFAFVCVDKGSSRAEIFELLLALKIPFIDVGIGLNRKRSSLNGMIRTTYYSAEHGDRVKAMRLAEVTVTDDNMYRANIQIGELNALNACLAVIKFKQVRGFYLDDTSPFHLLFEIGDLKIVGETSLNENHT